MSRLLNQRNKAAFLDQRANVLWSKGDLASAFKLFLSAAKAGFVPAYDIVAHFYDTGKGIKIDQSKSLYWYTRSFREGNAWFRAVGSTPANNIGCIWRDRNQAKKAIAWFRRAVELGDGDANLNIAKIYIRSRRDRAKTIQYLRRTIKAQYVTDGSIKEAKHLLKELLKDNPKKSPKRGSKRSSIPG